MNTDRCLVANRPASALSESLDRLCEMADRIDSLSIQLNERLGPILSDRPAPPTACDDRSPVSGGEFVGILMDKIGYLSSSAIRLEEILRRLDV